MKKTEVKDIIKNRRLELGLSFRELGKLCGVDKTTVRKWELGLIENMRRDKMVLLSKALDISPLVLLGLEDYIPQKEVMDLTPSDRILVYDSIFANEFGNVVDEIESPYPHEKGHLFALEIKISNDMMNSFLTDPKIYVIFKKLSKVENGTLVAVAIGTDKAQIKKYYNFEDVIVLRSPTSESGDPMTIVGDQIKDVCILGKIVGIVSPFVD